MKRLILSGLLAGFSLTATADVTRFFDHCDQFIGMQIGQFIYSAEYIDHGLNEEDASRVLAEIALIKLGQSQMYDVNLRMLIPDMRCS